MRLLAINAATAFQQLLRRLLSSRYNFFFQNKGFVKINLELYSAPGRVLPIVDYPLVAL